MDGLAPSKIMNKDQATSSVPPGPDSQSPRNPSNTSQSSPKPPLPPFQQQHSPNETLVDPSHAIVPRARSSERQTHDSMAVGHGDDTQHRKNVALSSRPHMLPTSNSAPVGRLPQLLPYDASAYTDALPPLANITNATISLSELAHLIRLQKYREQLRSQSRIRLHRWLVQAAVSSRFLHAGELAHKAIIDSFKNDNKADFRGLYNALHDIQASCDATRRYATLESEQDNDKRRLTKVSEPTHLFSTFMHEIPQPVRIEFLAFIDELRTNPDFLASRIASLNPSELASLVSFRPPMDPGDTLAAKTKASGFGQRVTASSGPTPVERLLSFNRHDPLSTLIYTIFASSSGPDSAEDLRRTDTWATTCARLLIDCKPGLQPVWFSVLDAWVGLRGWSAKSNFETFLMGILQDGQFLIDRWEAHASRQSMIQVQMTDKQLAYATEEFFDSSVKKLFEFLDENSNAGGIPEGVVEMGTAIVKKLAGQDKVIRAQAEMLIIQRWLFSVFLPNALTWPESHGIMTGYHISAKAREYILKEISGRAQMQARSIGQELATRSRSQQSAQNVKSNIPSAPMVIPEIKAHMENILLRFRHPKTSARPTLQPAKTVTSPRETIEVQPFLVICPSDIITLVNSLFPESRHPASQTDLDAQRRGLASSASSMSGITIPFRPGPSSTPGDGSSILSQSASSATSGTTSREPLLQSADTEPENEGRMALLDGHPIQVHYAPTANYGRRLRSACAEMSRMLGSDAIAGTCHPCAERWAVLYVGDDGKGLRTRMKKDDDDDDDTEDDSLSSDSDDDAGDDARPSLALEFDYHQLKNDIFRLLQEYEVPKKLIPESDTKILSNRGNYRKKQGGKQVRVQVVDLDDPNAIPLPLTQGNIASLNAPQAKAAILRQRVSKDAKQRPKVADLQVMLEAAYYQCSERNQWVDAQRWHRTLDNLKRMSAESLAANGFAALLNFFARGPREAVAKSFSAIDEFDAWFTWLKQSLDRYDSQIGEMMAGFKIVRDKMWYKTAVITSASYDEARNVAIALRTMGQPPKTINAKTGGAPKGKTATKPANNNFLLKTEAQVLELMAANADLAGHGKLADEQAILTSQWLIKCGVENICKGEERIHRFCYEVDRCVNKLVGDNTIEAPVLWSSELYHRDQEIFNSGRQRGDLFLRGVGTLSIAGDEEYESHSRSGPTSLDFVQRPPIQHTRSLESRGSQKSFGSSTLGSGSRGINLMDSQDYFGVSSPALTIDSSQTFWSPFQPQATSLTGPNTIHPNTSSSTRDTAILKNTKTVNIEKNKFVLDLKQVLTSLLLSDLGSVVFTAGSETDLWFSGDLGEECAARRDAEDLLKRQRIARKKSLKALRKAQGNPEAKLAAERMLQSLDAEQSSSSEATARSAGRLSKRSSLLDFPYPTAFSRTLAKFATHPSPFAKLQALFELDLLVVASLTLRSNRGFTALGPLPEVPQAATLGSTPELAVRGTTVPVQTVQTVGDSIANATIRRDHSIVQQQALGRDSPMKSSASGTRAAAVSTDQIIEVLQSLFRDAAIRPKTLFRDLQYIAALVPASMLDNTVRGKAFWDVTIAALGLKQDYVGYLVGIAANINAADNDREKHDREKTSHSTDPKNTTDSQTTDHTQSPPISKFTLPDAARILTITAKEGDAEAQRELAIFCLTHPNLAPRTLPPLVKLKDVFKNQHSSASAQQASAQAAKSGSSKSGSSKEEGRPDVSLMEMAICWMKAAQKGGDELAERYLTQQREMDGI